MNSGHSRSFDISGCVLEFVSGNRELTDWISADFAAFPDGTGSAPDITIRADIAPLPRELPRSLFCTRAWNILSSPRRARTILYPEGGLSEYDYISRRGRIISPDIHLLKEISYLAILSRVGEELDMRGFHRLHASALAEGGRALVFCGRQGEGKTTLGLELLKDPGFSLLSDDTPLIAGDGTVHGFPLRIGLAKDSPHLSGLTGLRGFKRRRYPDKMLLGVPESGTRISPPRRPGFIFKLVRGAAPAFRRPSPGAAVRELSASLIAGMGVPQMAEYFLRLSPGDLAIKAGILASRVRAARALISRAPFIVFETGPDPAVNAGALKAFLRNGNAAACPRP